MVGRMGRVYVYRVTSTAWYTMHVPLGAPPKLKVTFVVRVAVRGGRSGPYLEALVV